MKPRTKTRPGVPKTLMKSGSLIVEIWNPLSVKHVRKPCRQWARHHQGERVHKQRTEHQPKPKQHTVEIRSRSKPWSRSLSRPGSRAGSRDRWESSRWTEKKGKEGGIHVIGEKQVLISKVKNSIILPSRQGKWIPISVCNLNKKNNNDFFPLFLNRIIKLVVSKFSPQSGVLRSPFMYLFNINNNTL